MKVDVDKSMAGRQHGSRSGRALAVCLAMLLLASLVTLGNSLLQTAKAQNFDNARVADCGLAELGTTRPTGWDQPGECIKSVQRWVTAAGGYFGPGGVSSGYANSGAVQVSATEATKGDIVQWTNGDDNDWSHPHTVCIVQNYGNGRYWIVQSNWEAPGLVSQNLNWDPNPESYGRAGYYPVFWRFGTVASPPPITGGHDVVGAVAPARVFYFAEGTCRPDFNPYFCIQNPGAVDAAVRITYMKGDGANVIQTVMVPKSSRVTVSAKAKLGEGDDAAHDFSSKVECTNGQQIIAERPMYFDYKGWTGGSDVVGATSPASVYYFAEGTCRPDFDPFFCIENPGSVDAAVTITYMKGDGATDSQTVTVPKSSRVTVSAKAKLGEGDDPAHDFSSKVECTNGQQIIVERPMYFDFNGVWTGGHDVVGATAPATTYYFAEGTCRPDFSPFFCIQNPGALDARVRITYMKGNGAADAQEVTVPKHSRVTLSAKARLGEGDDAAHDFSARVECTNGQPIIVERPMYFSVPSGAH